MGEIPTPVKLATEQRLVEDWMLDETAASRLAEGVSLDGHRYIHDISEAARAIPDGAEARDEHRREITAVVRGESTKKLMVIGPCSIDPKTDYEELFTYMGELQQDNNDVIVAFRGNGSKPRTDGKWRGSANSTDPAEQEKVVGVYQDAFERELPILTEITDRDEFAAFAPYLSAMWLGARDLRSTVLRSLFSATRLPALLKNGMDGNPGTLATAIEAVQRSTASSDGSGVNLGMLGYTYRPNGVGLPGMIEVGEGNPNVGIIARGYALPETMPAEEKEREGIKHLGEMCTLAAEVGCTVLLDGSHGVPPMFDIPSTESDRFLSVMEKIRKEIEEGNIPHSEQIRGYIGEVSTTYGRTDKNLLVSEARESGRLASLTKAPLAA